MVRYHAGSENQRQQIRFIQILNTYGQKVFIHIAQQDKPYLLTEESGKNSIIDEITHAQDDAHVTIGFVENLYQDEKLSGDHSDTSMMLGKNVETMASMGTTDGKYMALFGGFGILVIVCLVVFLFIYWFATRKSSMYEKI